MAAMRADAATLLAAVSTPGVLTATVPSCPEWVVGDLARHVGSFYRRIRLNAGSARADEPWGPLVIADEAPAADDPEVVAWLGAQIAQTDAHLEALDADTPTWNFAPQAKVASFWHRRAAHETAVHRWDAQLGAGVLPEPIESKLAGDAVAEVLDTFLPAGRRRSAGPVAGVVALVASDLGQDWYVRLRGEGVALLDTDTLLDDDSHPTRAYATATASDLALALWGRVAFDVAETEGDPALLESLRVG